MDDIEVRLHASLRQLGQAPDFVVDVADPCDEAPLAEEPEQPRGGGLGV